MRYRHVVKGRFLERPNRFIAQVELAGRVETVHVKNTGRCKELLVPDAVVYLEESGNPARKTAYDLIAVEKGIRLINLDSQAPNRVFGEWVRAGHFLPELLSVWPEYTVGRSRLDFALQTPAGFHYVEVKGVTLEWENAVYFPDAPTERGIKHLNELRSAAAAGIDATAAFVVQMEQADFFAPNDITHPAFGETLRTAAAEGVHVCAFSCRVEPDLLEIAGEIPVRLTAPNNMR